MDGQKDKGKLAESAEYQEVVYASICSALAVAVTRKDYEVIVAQCESIAGYRDVDEMLGRARQSMEALKGKPDVDEERAKRKQRQGKKIKSTGVIAGLVIAVIVVGLVVTGARREAYRSRYVNVASANRMMLEKHGGAQYAKAQRAFMGRRYATAYEQLIPAVKKASERRRAAELAEQKRLAAEAEKKRLAEEAERKRKAYEEAERKRLAEEAERKRLAEEAEQRRLAQELERRRMEGEVERRRLAEEAERSRMEGEAERKRLAEGSARRRSVGGARIVTGMGREQPTMNSASEAGAATQGNSGVPTPDSALTVLGEWREHWGTPGQTTVTYHDLYRVYQASDGSIKVQIINRNQKISSENLNGSLLAFTQQTDAYTVRYLLNLQQDGKWLAGTATTPNGTYNVKWERTRFGRN